MVINRTQKSCIVAITCECGAEILLVPDVKEMSRAIENHVEAHRKKEIDPKKGQAEADRIEDLLIKQTFEKAAQE